MKMKTASYVRLLFLVFFSTENRTTDAWTSVATTKNIATRRIQKCRRRPRVKWEKSVFDCRRQTKNYGIVRRHCATHLLLHIKSDDDDGFDAEEEEFYREYENSYSLTEPMNTDNESSHTENLTSKRNGKQQQDDVPNQPTMASTNRKVEIAKAWDEALTEQTNADGGKRISNLSDLERKLQQIQRRKSEDYSMEGRDNDTMLSPEREGDSSDARGPKRKVADEFSFTNDQYSQILKKAQERLTEMTDSNFNLNVNQNTEKKTLVSNMSGLQERLNQIQRDASAKESSDTESSAFGVPSAPKYIDDVTLAEWEELDNQLQRDALKNAAGKRSPPPSILQDPTQEGLLADEAAILGTLRMEPADNSYDFNQEDIDSGISETIYSPIDGEDSVDPNSIPPEYKKFVSDYEFTEDGGVFLSTEAYQEASNIANPDGSLNLARGDTDNGMDNRQQSSTLKSAFADDEPPMAPYGDSDSALSRKELSIKDLTEQASRSLEFARKNPEAQEELHRRLMAEFEAEEPTSSAFESELLLDPEKAIAFWNQQYAEERKVESDALEDLLDEKMRELEKIRNQLGNSNNEVRPERRMDSQKEAYKDDDNIFFASKQDRIDRKRMIERDRRERARSIAKFYENYGENSSWDSTSESKEVEEINSRQSSQKENTGDIIDITSEEIVEESAQDSISIRDDNQERLLDADQQEQGEDEWTFDEDPEWVFVEDPESPEDSFYWNELTSEMRRDPPDGL